MLCFDWGSDVFFGYYQPVNKSYTESWCFLHNVVCSSGHAIAVEALGAVMKAYDGRGPSTTLGEKILEELKLASAEDLLG